MSGMGRNVRCSCGSGLKYKHCCLRRRDEVALDVVRAEAVWERMQSWALGQFGGELAEALAGHLGDRGIGNDENPATDDDLSVALCWLLIDRHLDGGGGTPAQRYTALPGLAERERAYAKRIAGSGLGLHRVTDVVPGVSVDLEDVLSGAVVRVSSPNVSRQAARWHVLLCRVMPGDPGPTLWGGAAFYQPSEEAELLDELRRIATTEGLGAGPAGLSEAFRVGARQLLCFVPPSRRAEPAPYTLEGDRVSIVEASWRVWDPARAVEALSQAPELVAAGPTEDGKGVLFHWVTSRDQLVARRPVLPAGAICLESGPVSVHDDGSLELDDATSLGDFTLYGDRLGYSGISEARLDAAVALVEHRLGDLASRPTHSVSSIDDARATSATRSPSVGRRRPVRPATKDEPAIPDTQLRDLLHHRWIDDPNQHLDGLSPRAAAAKGGYAEQLESLLRNIEHHSANERGDRRPGPEVAWLRAALGLAAGARHDSRAAPARA